MTVAAVIVIGNEILSGKFPDENGPFFIRRLRRLGVELRRLVFVDDDVARIADEVRRCSEQADHVFTTGGVGPTHDDVTFEGVAAAFGLPLRLRPELVEQLRRFGLSTDGPNLRMATLPEGAETIFGEGLRYPVIRVRNVWILPGVPELARRKFEVVAPRIAGSAVSCVRIYARDCESDRAAAIGEVQASFPGVAVGSYPRFDAEDHALIVTLESRDLVALAAAREAMVARLDVVRVEEEPAPAPETGEPGGWR